MDYITPCVNCINGTVIYILMNRVYMTHSIKWLFSRGCTFHFISLWIGLALGGGACHTAVNWQWIKAQQLKITARYSKQDRPINNPDMILYIILYNRNSLIWRQYIQPREAYKGQGQTWSKKSFFCPNLVIMPVDFEQWTSKDWWRI